MFEPISSQRHAFAIPPDLIYMNNAYLSPLHENVREAGIRGVSLKATPWKVKPSDFFEEADRCRALFAELVGASSNDVALVPAASYGIGIAAKNLKPRAGTSILVLAEQFPSNVYPWRDLASRTGCHMLTVARPADGDWTSAVLAELDERVSIVALPPCHWTDGGLVDLVRVGSRCRELGVPLVVDATQAAGAMHLDVGEIRPAFLAAAGYKWLLGSYGLAYLYVAPEYQQGEPLEYNWITRKGSDNFARLVDYTDELAEGAVRFDMGERSHFATLPMNVAALRLILDWGVGRIEATLAAYNRELAAGAAELGFAVAAEGLRAPHLMGLRFQGPAPAGIAAALAERQVFVSVRGDAIRVAPYLYNDAEDRTRFLEILAELLNKG